MKNYIYDWIRVEILNSEIKRRRTHFEQNECLFIYLKNRINECNLIPNTVCLTTLRNFKWLLKITTIIIVIHFMTLKDKIHKKIKCDHIKQKQGIQDHLKVRI